VYLGSQLKTLYHIYTYGGDYLDLCRENTSAGSKPTASSRNSVTLPEFRPKFSPYGSQLTALILLNDTELSFKSKSSEEFLKICEISTEFHFPTASEQLNVLKESLKQQKKLDTGDFVITKHSNLDEVHLVFHLAFDKKNATEQAAKSIQGLKNILQMASRYDVANIAIPASLIPLELRHQFTEQQFLRHVESVLKAIRAFLIENSKIQQNSLKVIQIMIPKTDEKFEKVRSLISSINR